MTAPATVAQINAALNARALRRTLRHAPACTAPEVTITDGHAHMIARCPNCAAIATLRHGSTPKANPRRLQAGAGEYGSPLGLDQMRTEPNPKGGSL